MELRNVTRDFIIILEIDDRSKAFAAERFA
jgi:hypothetical protein